MQRLFGPARIGLAHLRLGHSAMVQGAGRKITKDSQQAWEAASGVAVAAHEPRRESVLEMRCERRGERKRVVRRTVVAMDTRRWRDVARALCGEGAVWRGRMRELTRASFHKWRARRGLATHFGVARRAYATAHREREFSSARVGTMGVAFSFPTSCIERRETSTSRPRRGVYRS